MLGSETITWKNQDLRKLVMKIIEVSVFLFLGEQANSEKMSKIFHSFIENMFPKGKTEVQRT